mmetsp:Transcript_64773/g.148321  ORF Transcript_64773/g.148321 Transcript_64773/m.148321 type:complete len:208 (-) Transcript_64773:102-725(-)
MVAAAAAATPGRVTGRARVARPTCSRPSPRASSAARPSRAAAAAAVAMAATVAAAAATKVAAAAATRVVVAAVATSRVAAAAAATKQPASSGTLLRNPPEPKSSRASRQALEWLVPDIFVGLRASPRAPAAPPRIAAATRWPRLGRLHARAHVCVCVCVCVCGARRVRVRAHAHPLAPRGGRAPPRLFPKSRGVLGLVPLSGSTLEA